jgi:hypothetical protein
MKLKGLLPVWLIELGGFFIARIPGTADLNDKLQGGI